MSGTAAAARRAIAAFLHASETAIGWDSPLSDAVSDSFVLVDLAVHLQQDFAVRFTHEDLARVKTPADLAALVAARSTEGTPEGDLGMPARHE
jgi:acyl carrier protein